MDYKVFESSEGNVSKYVFTTEKFVLESVLYKYESFAKRTVICCSIQSGCPVGCIFCGTGNKFIQNVDSDTIVKQIELVLKDKNIENVNSMCEKFQIMFMSMGEPMLNWKELKIALYKLNVLYPNAQLLISTIGVNNDEVFNDLIKISSEIDKIGLQFSIHKSNDVERNKLIPYKNKYSLREIRDRGMFWNKMTGRPVYLNYCLTDENSKSEDIENLKNLFSPIIFNFTFSVICEKDSDLKSSSEKQLPKIRIFEKEFLKDGYNTRIFDPAGQDDIGGGCGQLWYVQNFLNKKSNG